MTVFVEKIMKRKTISYITAIILVITPFIFLTTVYTAWFGPEEFVNQLKDELTSWFFIFLAEFIGFLALLPAREKARLMQFICFLSALFTFLFYLAILVRTYWGSSLPLFFKKNLDLK